MSEDICGFQVNINFEHMYFKFQILSFDLSCYWILWREYFAVIWLIGFQRVPKGRIRYFLFLIPFLFSVLEMKLFNKNSNFTTLLNPSNILQLYNVIIKIFLSITFVMYISRCRKVFESSSPNLCQRYHRSSHGDMRGRSSTTCRSSVMQSGLFHS